jgi:ankyrin repeat protein
MYNRILDQIEDDDVPYAIRILRWLAFASRPLSLREVAEIAALDSNRCPAFDPDEVLQDPSDVLTICSSLVTITDEDKLYPKVTITTLYSPKVYTKPVVILAHYSVKEYLVSDRILKSKARLYGVDPIICHQTLAKNCVQYLLRLEEHLPQLDELYDETFSPDEVLSDFALAKYSALQWKHHYDLVAKPKPELKELVVELFKSEKILTCTNRFKGFREFYNRDRYLTKLMYNACVSGQRLVSDTDVDINESNLACWTALDTASEKGYLDIVQFLLEKGATVTKQCLWLASYKGHLDIVKLLLEKDTEGKDVALSVASGQGNLEVVRLLVKHGASVNTEDKQGQRPLQSASSEGHLEVVQFLLENGARITEGCLWLASYKGHLDIVKLLLEKDTEGKVAALSVASGQGNLELVKFLVKHGAQVNTKRRRQRSLQSASAEDYGIFSGLVSNALFSALLGGHFHVARFLVEKEADVNAWGKERYGTASIAASAQERFDIVRYFVDQGATNREESR